MLFKKIIVFKEKWQQKFLSSHLKTIQNQNFYICFISWHILIRNIKLADIFDICSIDMQNTSQVGSPNFISLPNND